jgi:type I restriction enzyme M protein
MPGSSRTTSSPSCSTGVSATCGTRNSRFCSPRRATAREAADPEEHRFHVPPQHNWNAVRKNATQIGQHLNNAFAAIEDANLRLRGVFGDVDFANQERFPDARLERLLAHFEKHRLRNSDVPPDMLGDAYMYLIEQFAEGAGKKGGEFYTPRQVVKLIVECLDPQPGMSIYDPTCGSGGMLLEAVEHLKAKGQDPRNLSLYGQEKELDTWAIAQINLFLPRHQRRLHRQGRHGSRSEAIRSACG